MTEKWPTPTAHKGVGIHAGQPPKRVALVKREIDRVHRISDLLRLAVIAKDVSWAPEARIYAGVRFLAGFQRAVERREPRPDVDPQVVKAHTGALASRGWANPYDYCSLFDAVHDRAVPREVPLNGLSKLDNAD